MYFCFKSMRISFISKVTRLRKAVTVANNTSLCSTILVVFLEFTRLRSTGLKFPIWTHHRIRRPDNRASPVTGLIWRGPKSGQSYTEWMQFSIRFLLACSTQSNQRMLLVERCQQQMRWWLNKEHPSGPHFRPNEVTSLRLPINTQVIKL